jgi:hypothetical protein
MQNMSAQTENAHCRLLRLSPLVKCFAQDLWVAECSVGPDGEPVFHVETLEHALETNAGQIAHGWCANYVPFALCETREGAGLACDLMRRIQEKLVGAMT